MPDEPGWLGRAQWFPTVMPPAVPGTKLMIGLTVLFGLVAFVAAWVVADVTSSIGWGFLVGAILFFAGGPLFGLILAPIQRRIIDRAGK